MLQVAIAPWNAHDRLPGAGIIIYPAQNSSALLVGAIFLTSPFPEFVAPSSPHGQMMHSPTVMQPRHPSYQQMGSSPYGPMTRTHPHSSSSRHGHHPSPTDQPSPENKQDQYRYIMPRTVPPYSTGASSSSTDPNWPVVKDEEEGDLSAFTTSLRGGHGHYPQ